MVVGLLLAAAAALAAGARLAAHEVPNDVTIQAFLKPEANRLRLLVRVPLIALRDMTWPFKSPDMLDVSRATSELTDAATLWLGDEATMYEGDRALPSPSVAAIRATLPTDRSFESYDQALALVTGPPAPDTDDISIKEGFLDVLFEYPIESDASRFSINPRWGRLGIHALTIIRLILPDGTIRVFELQGDPGLVRLDPTGFQAARQFVRLGFEQLLGGTDHLLFLFALVIPFRRLRDLAVVIVAFTVAHSVTLLASAYGLAPDALWFPPLVTTLVAASIVYVALENLFGGSVRRRWIAAFGFGLFHGFAFAFGLRQTAQFAGAHLLASLLSFNVGVELAQVLVLAIAIPALELLFRFVVAERIGAVILSALVAHTGWHWTSDRGFRLWQYQFTWPELTPALLADVVRWLMIAVALAGAAWLISTMAKARSQKSQSA